MRYFPAILLLFVFACSTPKAATEAMAPKATYAGTYNLMVAGTPLGDVRGELTITESAEGLGGTFVSNGQNFKLKNVAPTDDGMTATFYYADYSTDVTIDLDGAPGAATLTGLTMGEFKTTAERQE